VLPDDDHASLNEHPASDPDVGWVGGELEDLVSSRRSQDDRIAGMSDRQTHLAAIICGALIVGFAGTGLLLTRMYPVNPKTDLSECAQVGDQSDRLACFDALAKGTAPFKGGSPFLTSSKPDL
jgi:hypothetical protein